MEFTLMAANGYIVVALIVVACRVMGELGMKKSVRTGADRLWMITYQQLMLWKKITLDKTRLGCVGRAMVGILFYWGIHNSRFKHLSPDGVTILKACLGQ
jgi:hypothetical protein